METNTPANVAKTLALGLQALATHLVDHNLGPSILDLQIPTVDRPYLTITVVSYSASAWLTHLAVDNEITEPSTVEGREWVRYDGRLPDSGVRVRVQYSHPAGLARVSA